MSDAKANYRYATLPVRPDLIRVSVGIEHIEDIKADFAHALRRAAQEVAA